MPGYKSVPQHVVEEIKSLEVDHFQIGVIRVAALEDIEAGKYTQLGVTAAGGEVRVTTPFLPQAASRWSRRNLAGQEVKRPDWPKQTRTWTTTSPNFGDGARFGYNTHMHSRDVTAKQTLHAKSFAYNVSVGKRPDGKLSIHFVLEPEFFAGIDLTSPDLLMAVSLTREIAGIPHVFALGGTSTAWNASQDFDWEFLPVDHGGRPVDFEAIADVIGVPTNSSTRDTFRERWDTIRELQPVATRYGSTGFARYVAFEFTNAVVLENYYYGNAAYVMYEDWQTLAKRTRLDLLSDPSARFERVIHSNGWRDKLKQAIQGKRGLSS